MPIQSWESTKRWKYTFASGGHFEESVKNVIGRYTVDIWHNVRIETLLTETGNTELDVVFCYGGLVFILELKRVRKIVGRYRDGRWTMYGWNSVNDETGHYSAQNVIEQNNIHARSLIDCYYAEFRAYPRVVPIVVVPDDCDFPVELRREVYTVSDLYEYLNQYRLHNNVDLVTRMSYLLGSDTGLNCRKDFIQKRNGVRGRP